MVEYKCLNKHPHKRKEFPMVNSIIYFEERCIKIFEKLEDDFLKNPKNFAEYVYGITNVLCKLGTEMLRESLEAMDQMLSESSFRRKSWSIEAHHWKTLTTSLGDVTFKKTLFLNKQTKEYSYLLDRILELDPNQRLTEDASARMLEEAVQTSYERGGQQVSMTTQVSRQTVKNKIHALQFPPENTIPEQKKVVDYLYMDADEDHVALQFREKKGDLTKAENGVKNNGLITKMVCVYEGKEEETFHGKRRVLTNCHYFCGVNSKEANLKFWDDIYQYLERNYDLDQVKKIYLNADGGSWIKTGAKRLKGVTYVLDGFHLEKCLIKLAPHLNRKERIPVLEEFRKTIRNQTKNDFRELVEKQKKGMPKWRKRAKVEEAAEYILSNWTGAKLRLKHKNGVLGSSMESHVSHILSARMSSRPMGWSRQGAAKMAELRAYYYNGGDMLELVRYQKKAETKESRKEEKILSSTQILISERNRHGELGKYLERISHSMSLQNKKRVYFQAQIRGL